MLRKMKLDEITSLTDEMKDSIRKRKIEIEKIVTVKEIILFGSRARDNYKYDSDVDLLILIDDEPKHSLRHKLNDSCYGITIGDKCDVDQIYKNYNKYYKGECISNTLKYNIEKDGITTEF